MDFEFYFLAIIFLVTYIQGRRTAYRQARLLTLFTKINGRTISVRLLQLNVVFNRALVLYFDFRGHNITLISAFAPDFHIPGLEEIAPEGLATYVRGYMTFDLVGARMRGEEPLPLYDILRYGYQVKGHWIC